VGDALRLRATSSFWAGAVTRDHRLVAFLCELLPRLVSLAPPPSPVDIADASDDDQDNEEEDEAEEQADFDDVRLVHEIEDEYDEDEGFEYGDDEEEKNELDADLAWIRSEESEASAEAASLMSIDQQQRDVEQQSQPEMTEKDDIDPRWEMLQEVRIAAEARRHELAIRSEAYWRDTVFHETDLDNGHEHDHNGDGEEDDFDTERAKPKRIETEVELDKAQALALVSSVRLSLSLSLTHTHTTFY
jgi:hypothetical protein